MIIILQKKGNGTNYFYSSQKGLEKTTHQQGYLGTPLVVQGLRFLLSPAEGGGLIPGVELRSCMVQSKKVWGGGGGAGADISEGPVKNKYLERQIRVASIPALNKLIV